MFESRPIWSRNAVKANINIQPDKLKLLLPVVAYYMVSREAYHPCCKIIDWSILSATMSFQFEEILIANSQENFPKK